MFLPYDAGVWCGVVGGRFVLHMKKRARRDRRGELTNTYGTRQGRYMRKCNKGLKGVECEVCSVEMCERCSSLWPVMAATVFEKQQDLGFRERCIRDLGRKLSVFRLSFRRHAESKGPQYQGNPPQPAVKRESRSASRPARFIMRIRNLWESPV